MKLSFSNNAINSRLCKYLAAKDLLDKVIADTESYSSKENHKNSVKEIMNDLEEIKNHLMDSNMVVTKDTKGIVVKN